VDECKALPGTRTPSPWSARSWARCVAAKLNLKAKVESSISLFQFQVLGSRRFQHGFDRVNVHRPTDQLGRHHDLLVCLHPGAYTRSLLSST